MTEPRSVTKQREELIALLDKDDDRTITAKECAAWIGMDERTLRKSIREQRASFVIGIEGAGKGYSVINKFVFWNWVQQKGAL